MLVAAESVLRGPHSASLTTVRFTVNAAAFQSADVIIARIADAPGGAGVEQ